MNSCFSKIVRVFLAVIVLTPLAANAYIGPGAGAGVVATVLGILAGIMMLVVGVVWYPIKRLYNWIRRAGKS